MLLWLSVTRDFTPVVQSPHSGNIRRRPLLGTLRRGAAWLPDRLLTRYLFKNLPRMILISLGKGNVSNRYVTALSSIDQGSYPGQRSRLDRLLQDVGQRLCTESCCRIRAPMRETAQEASDLANPVAIRRGSGLPTMNADLTTIHMREHIPLRPTSRLLAIGIRLRACPNSD